jgi:hypothetical protein
MTFKEYLKEKDAQRLDLQKQEAAAAVQVNEKSKDDAMAKLDEKLTAGLPSLRGQLGEITYGFVDNTGAFGDFTLEGKPFRVYTRPQGSPISGQSILVVCVKEAKGLREVGNVIFDRQNAIFPKFEEGLTNLLRKELKF